MMFNLLEYVVISTGYVCDLCLRSWLVPYLRLMQENGSCQVSTIVITWYVLYSIQHCGKSAQRKGTIDNDCLVRIAQNKHRLLA